jgi:4-hydroxybenzoate polyprenyltransferase
VTVAGTVLAVVAGNPPQTCVLIAAAVLTGQLTVGWTNDRFDFRPDRAMQRRDKPVAAGQIPPAVVDRAIVVAVVLTVGLSLALGWRAGLIQVAAVGCGWLYNFCLKGTWVSWLPYSAGFAALPVVATQARPAHSMPAAWIIAGAALLGVVANLTNTLPDLARRHPSGFRGLPDRVGAHPSLIFALALTEVGVILAAIGPPGPVTPVGRASVGVVSVALTVSGPYLWRAAATRRPFYILMALSSAELIIVMSDPLLR